MRTLRARLDKVEAEGLARAIYCGNRLVTFPSLGDEQCQHAMRPIEYDDFWSALYPDSYIVQCGKCGLCVGMKKERS